MVSISAYAALTAGASLTPFTFDRRAPSPHDVAIDILFCGICHSDLHFVDNRWGFSSYPMVPGHEIVGRVARIGAEVTKFAVGDLAAIGCLVDSCRVCDACVGHLEQMCAAYPTPTYNGVEREGRRPTQGGYSSAYVADERFVLKVPSGLDPAAAAPLLCAGITTYSPLRRFRVGPGMRIGIVGLGGLGHIAIKLARAMGAEITVITTSPHKAGDAMALGASEVIVSTDATQMAARRGQFDLILDTVSAAHDLDALIGLLSNFGTLSMVGAPDEPHRIGAFSLLTGNKSVTGSGIGGLRETQEMLDFCARHGIVADIELLPVDRVNEAFDRLRRNDVKYRFVLDMAPLAA